MRTVTYVDLALQEAAALVRRSLCLLGFHGREVECTMSQDGPGKPYRVTRIWCHRRIAAVFAVTFGLLLLQSMVSEASASNNKLLFRNPVMSISQTYSADNFNPDDADEEGSFIVSLVGALIGGLAVYKGGPALLRFWRYAVLKGKENRRNRPLG